MLHYDGNSGLVPGAPVCTTQFHMSSSPPSKNPLKPSIPSVLAWPAWLRVLAVLPAVALLWLAVAWAQLEVAPW